MRHALLHASSGKVQNLIELPDDYAPDAEGAWTPPPGHRVEPDPDGEAIIGGHLTDNGWTPPPADEPDPAEAEAAALEADVVAAENEFIDLLGKLAGDGLSSTDRARIPDLAVKALGGRAKVERLRGRR